MIKEAFNNLLTQGAPGPAVSFTVFDLFRAIEIIANKQPIGRGRLSHILELGGGAMRTMIKRLKNSELITTSKLGCSLTEKGEDVWNQVKLDIPKKFMLKTNDLTPTESSVVVLIRNCGEKIGHGLEQRDAAVRAGAKGAITLILRGNKLGIPMVSQDISEDYPETFRQIKQAMSPEENDAIIIAYANNTKNAECGALAAAWTLIN